jgi:hypothetical protein
LYNVFSRFLWPGNAWQKGAAPPQIQPSSPAPALPFPRLFQSLPGKGQTCTTFSADSFGRATPGKRGPRRPARKRPANLAVQPLPVFDSNLADIGKKRPGQSRHWTARRTWSPGRRSREGGQRNGGEGRRMIRIRSPPRRLP